MLLLLLALQATPARVDSIPGTDSIPRITLAEAVRRSSKFDPDYVRALGEIDNAEWGRRAAMIAFFIPSIDLGLDQTKYSESFFNPADPANPTQTLVVGRASANYEIFSLRKFSEISRTKADLASAEASELEQRFRAALETESAYYDVLVNQELSRVNRERARRAREGLGVARARVSSGAAVQTDSLQLVLELVRSQVDSLRQANALRTAQLELGRRVGADGPVGAVPAGYRAGRPTPGQPPAGAADRPRPGPAIPDSPGQRELRGSGAEIRAGRIPAGAQRRRSPPAV